MRYFLYIVVFFGFSSCSIIQLSKTNSRDDIGRRQGRWIQYWDDSAKIKMYDGWFLNDTEYKKSKFYDPSGKISARFRYCKNDLKVRYYDNGKLVRKGRSILIRNEEGIAYYFHGKWKFYNSQGRLIRISDFEMGEEKRVIMIRDSLGNKVYY